METDNTLKIKFVYLAFKQMFPKVLKLTTLKIFAIDHNKM